MRADDVFISKLGGGMEGAVLSQSVPMSNHHDTHFKYLTV